LGVLGLVGASGQELRNANFDIRFEPTAILQTGTEIRFDITVKDGDHHPVHGAQVTLQIETPEHEHTKVFRATELQTGVYMAKPLFPVKGQWDVYVEVHREDEVSARTIEYYVPK
jgi:nitrogen fixation protein FixH